MAVIGYARRLAKYVSEKKKVHFDLSAHLPTGVLVSSVTQQGALLLSGATGDLIVDSPVLDQSQKIVQVRLRAGTKGVVYEVWCQLVWTDGQEREVRGYLEVA